MMNIKGESGLGEFNEGTRRKICNRKDNGEKPIVLDWRSGRHGRSSVEGVPEWMQHRMEKDNKRDPEKDARIEQFKALFKKREKMDEGEDESTIIEENTGRENEGDEREAKSQIIRRSDLFKQSEVNIDFDRESPPRETRADIKEDHTDINTEQLKGKYLGTHLKAPLDDLPIINTGVPPRFISRAALLELWRATDDSTQRGFLEELYMILTPTYEVPIKATRDAAGHLRNSANELATDYADFLCLIPTGMTKDVFQDMFVHGKGVWYPIGMWEPFLKSYCELDDLHNPIIDPSTNRPKWNRNVLSNLSNPNGGVIHRFTTCKELVLPPGDQVRIFNQYLAGFGLTNDAGPKILLKVQECGSFVVNDFVGSGFLTDIPLPLHLTLSNLTGRSRSFSHNEWVQLLYKSRAISDNEFLGRYIAKSFSSSLLQGGTGEMLVGKALYELTRDSTPTLLGKLLNGYRIEWRRRFYSAFVNSPRFIDFFLSRSSLVKTGNRFSPFEWNDKDGVNVEVKTGHLENPIQLERLIKEIFGGAIGMMQESKSLPSDSYAGTLVFISTRDTTAISRRLINGFACDSIRWEKGPGNRCIGLVRLTEKQSYPELSIPYQQGFHVLFEIEALAHKVLSPSVDKTQGEAFGVRLSMKIGELRDSKIFHAESVWYNSFDDSGFMWNGQHCQARMLPTPILFNEISSDGISYSPKEYAILSGHLQTYLDRELSKKISASQSAHKWFLENAPSVIRDLISQQSGIPIQPCDLVNGRVSGGFVVKSLLNALENEKQNSPNTFSAINLQDIQSLVGDLLPSGGSQDIGRLARQAERYGVVFKEITCPGLTGDGARGDAKLKALFFSIDEYRRMQQYIDSRFHSVMPHAENLAERIMGKIFLENLQKVSRGLWDIDVKCRLIRYAEDRYRELFSQVSPLARRSMTDIDSIKNVLALFSSLGRNIMPDTHLFLRNGELSPAGVQLWNDWRNAWSLSIPNKLVHTAIENSYVDTHVREFARNLYRAYLGKWPDGKSRARAVGILREFLALEPRILGTVQFRVECDIKGFRVLDAITLNDKKYVSIEYRLNANAFRQYICRFDPYHDIFADGIEVYVVHDDNNSEWRCSWQSEGEPDEQQRLSQLWQLIRGGTVPPHSGSRGNTYSAQDPVKWLHATASDPTRKTIIGLLPP